MSSLSLAIIAAMVTIVGWFVTDLLKFQSEKKGRRLQEKIHYLERQIEEFYGPLFNVVYQIQICNDSKTQMIGKAKYENVEDAQIVKMTRFFQEEYFIPLQKEFNSIIKTKLYLIDKAMLPVSMYAYLRFSVHDNVRMSLWNELPDREPYVGMTNDLYLDIKEELDSIMVKYNYYIKKFNRINDEKSLKKEELFYKAKL